MSVGYCRISAAAEPAVKSDKCPKSGSWNIAEAPLVFRVLLRDPIHGTFEKSHNVRMAGGT